MKDKVKLSDFPLCKENPFLEKSLEVVKENTIKRRKYFTANKVLCDVVNSVTGETEAYQSFLKYVKVDEQQFTKLYTSRLKSFFELGNAAIRVFCYIQTKVKPNTDTFIFDIESCEEFTNQSRPTIYKGLAELVKNEIIARGKFDYLYYLNPMIFFNGDRIVFAEAIVKKKQKEVEDKNQLALDFSTSQTITEYGNIEL